MAALHLIDFFGIPDNCSTFIPWRENVHFIIYHYRKHGKGSLYFCCIAIFYFSRNFIFYKASDFFMFVLKVSSIVPTMSSNVLLSRTTTD